MEREAISQHFQGDFHSFYSKYLPKIKAAGGNEYQALCPFHDDTDPSFNFNNQNGAYYCHGCGKKGGFFHFYAKINGHDTKRDFPKILKGIAADFGINSDKPKRRIIATYDYVDLQGNCLFQVCRMEPKSFRQRRPDGKGGWIYKDVFNKQKGGVDPILYNLPQVHQAQEVLLVEGEKDVETLKDLGFVATTCPMGAKKWREAYNETLKGKDVVLIPDNDNEGRQYMAQVGAAIKDGVASLKWLEVPELPSKGDISDYIIKFTDKEIAAERIVLLLNDAKPYEPPKPKSYEDAFLNADEFQTLPLPPKQTYLDPWLTEQSITLISGWRGVGKTWFGMALVDALTSGEGFGPWDLTNSISCAYIEAEMASQDVQERLNWLNPSKTRQHPLWIYSDSHAAELGLPRSHLLNEKWRDFIKRNLLTRKIKLLVLDNLASLASGIDENSKKDWDPINGWLLELRFAGIATVMFHHVSKEGSQRGTSGREDNIDNSIMLKPPPDYTSEDGARFICSFTKSRGVRQRDLPLTADHVFQLTEDEAGKSIWTWGTTKAETKVEILRLLDEGCKQTEVALQLGIHKGWVSRIRKRAIESGEMTYKNKLTQSGNRTVFGDGE
jgi:hypothetical protein